MFALLESETLAFSGAVLPLASSLTPTSRSDPDWLFATWTPAPPRPNVPGRVIVTTPEAQFTVVIAVMPAKTPDAPSIRIGSCVGICAPPPAPSVLFEKPLVVIGDGNVIRKSVVVNVDEATNEPEIKIPEPVEVGSDVFTCRPV